MALYCMQSQRCSFTKYFVRFLPVSKKDTIKWNLRLNDKVDDQGRHCIVVNNVTVLCSEDLCREGLRLNVI